MRTSIVPRCCLLLSSMDTGCLTARRPSSPRLLRYLNHAMTRPTFTHAQAVSALAGRWKLVYTSNVGTVMLLGALDNLPLVDVGDVCQTIDPVTLTATNKVDLAVPMMLSLRAESGLEVRSPRQFKVRGRRGGDRVRKMRQALSWACYLAPYTHTHTLSDSPAGRTILSSLQCRPVHT